MKRVRFKLVGGLNALGKVKRCVQMEPRPYTFLLRGKAENLTVRRIWVVNNADEIEKKRVCNVVAPEAEGGGNCFLVNGAHATYESTLDRFVYPYNFGVLFEIEGEIGTAVIVRPQDRRLFEALNGISQKRSREQNFIQYEV